MHDWNHLLRRGWLGAALTALVAFPGLAANGPTQERLDALVEALEQARVEMHIPGMALAVVHDDRIVLAHGFGQADIESNRPVTPETIFAVGSTTKAFTSALIGMLVDEGKMDWDDPVSQYLPYFQPTPRDAKPDSITLRDALSHRSGFARMSMLWAGGGVSRREALTVASNAKPWADFRTTFNYNNVMYLAAGEASAKAGKRSWEKLMTRRLLQPLGMESSTLTIRAAQRDDRLATGYVWDSDREEFRVETMRDLKAIAPAGSINSNVRDMARWIRLQLGNGEFDGQRLVSQKALDETKTAQISIAPGINYGLGWMLRAWNGMQVVEHGGNIDGFAAQVALLPERDTGFVLLTNVSGTPLQQASINMVWETLYAEPAEEGAEEDLQPYVGEYIANFATFNDATFTVSVTDGKLAVDVPGQTNYKLKPPTEDGRRPFELTDTIAVSFDRNDAGEVVAMRMHQAGFDFEIPRKGVEFPVEIPLEDLQAYLGKYRDEERDVEFEVLIQNNRLTIDVPDPLKFELHPPDDDGLWAFRIRADQAVRFDRDEEGRVVAMTRFRNGEEADTAQRIGGATEGESDLPTLSELDALRDLPARLAAIERIGTLRDVGKVYFEQAGIEGKVTVEIAGLDRHRVDVDLGRYGRITTVLNGDAGRVDSSVDEPDDLAGVRLKQLQQGHPFVLFGDWRTEFETIQVVRADTFNERETWVVKLESQDVPALTLHLDAATGDILHSLTVTPLLGGAAQMPVETRYEDYREVAGLRMPFRTITTNSANGNVVMVSGEGETGIEIPARRFRIEPN